MARPFGGTTAWWYNCLGVHLRGGPFTALQPAPDFRVSQQIQPRWHECAIATAVAAGFTHACMQTSGRAQICARAWSHRRARTHASTHARMHAGLLPGPPNRLWMRAERVLAVAQIPSPTSLEGGEEEKKRESSVQLATTKDSNPALCILHSYFQNRVSKIELPCKT